jgi:Tat protein translocase TatC
MPVQEEPFEDTRMTLGEHLAELRTRLFRGLVAVVIAFALAWWQQETITLIVIRPFEVAVAMINESFAETYAAKVAEGVDPLTYFDSTDPATWKLRADKRAAATLTALGPAEGFTFLLRVCLYFALFVGGPFLLWQLWQFIAAGLYPDERKAALRYFPYSVLLFVVGVLFGYFAMVPYGMYFLGTMLPSDYVVPQYQLKEYFSLLSALSLALAVIFQLPVMMTFAARLGLIEPRQMASYRGYFIVGAFFVGAILTPPDPVTQCMMAVPMIVLYEIGLIAARVSAQPRRTHDRDAAAGAPE